MRLYPRLSDAAVGQGAVAQERTPLRLSFMALAQGLATPHPERSFTWCELGAADAQGLVIKAAANPQGRFIALDASRRNIQSGRRLAEAAGVNNLIFIEAGLRALALEGCAHTPRYDFIVTGTTQAMGDRADRQAIRRVIERWLKPGGLALFDAGSRIPHLEPGRAVAGGGDSPLDDLCFMATQSVPAACATLLRGHERHLGAGAVLLEALAARPRRLAELRDLPEIGGGLMAALANLVRTGLVQPCRPTAPAGNRCQPLNRLLCEQALANAEGGRLAAPALGAAIPAEPLHMAALRVLLECPDVQGDLLQEMVRIVLLDAGIEPTVQTPSRLETFERIVLPYWRTVGVLPAIAEA